VEIVLRLKCDGTRAETRFLLSAKRILCKSYVPQTAELLDAIKETFSIHVPVIISSKCKIKYITRNDFCLASVTFRRVQEYSNNSVFAKQLYVYFDRH
jgi:hypothetical protein